MLTSGTKVRYPWNPSSGAGMGRVKKEGQKMGFESVH
jgi:hypothetical protein